ncbi:TadE/TadG family type IV pilus assembly protein [Rhizobium sp. SL86]|uniref:TadE/TadG family type IV pilus assembly protein n=1 Tax=Rhizobium sp. SL86 TaxID=2995148 RepID=UPI002275B7A6|nr:TadE family protein [Rhizobium sp. SL86]MCY1667616.1 pilus assembly protein [Rhizobium sp. SL86]
MQIAIQFVGSDMRTSEDAIHSYLRNGDGSSAVEFALILPVFVLFIAVTFTGGMLLYAHSTISTYAREAARGLALGYMTQAEAQQFAQLNVYSSLGVDVKVSIDPAVADDENDQDVIVSISIDKSEIKKIMVFGDMIFQGISATVTMRSMPD